jgi:hypothetical protein
VLLKIAKMTLRFKLIKNILSLTFVALALVACKEDTIENPIIKDTSLNVKVRLLNNGAPYSLSSTFQNTDGVTLRVDVLKFYLSNFNLVNANNEKTELFNLAFFEFGTKDTLISIPNPPEGVYHSIETSVGVPARMNGTDNPNNEFNVGQFPPEHPLSTTRGMYWNWQTAYRFVILEGRSNANNTGAQLLTNLVYHPGTNPAFRTTTIPLNSFTVEPNAANQILLTIDIQDILFPEGNEMDLQNENISHTVHAEEVAFKFMDNFTNALKIKQ